MSKPEKRKTSNKTFRDPHWYVSLAADALDLKFASLAKNLGKALKPETQDIAKELLSLYQQAFEKTLADLSIDKSVKLSKKVKELFFDAILDPDFPSHHPVFNLLLNKLELEYGDESDRENWQIRRSEIRQVFARNFHATIQLGEKKFAHATDYIESLRKQSEPLESQVVSHMNSVIENVEHDGLAIDQQLRLRRSYISPAFDAKHKTSRNDKEMRWNGDDLLSSLIKSIEGHAAPIIVHGQPGHGKTSSVKMLLTTLANIYQEEQNPISVLFYEFKNLRALNNPILQVLKPETSFLSDEQQFHGRHTVMILDGLDERQITDGSDEELKGFVSGLFRMATRLNKQSSTKFNLILTGRSQFVGQIRSCFNSDHFTYEIEDFNDEKVSLWLKRFGEQKKDAEPITIKHLKSHHLDELISQPILLAISTIMLCDDYGQKLFDKISHSEINRTMVYQTIVQWSYEKRWQHAPSSSSLQDKLTFDEYFRMLKAIAFEMYVAGEENIKLSKLAIRLKGSSFDLDFIENQNESTIEELCSQLRISFFFKGVEEKAFSFIHKSIKDFLMVRAIIDGLHEILQDLTNIKKVDQIARELFKLLSRKILSSEDHIPMLDQLLRTEYKQLSKHDEKLLAIWDRVGAQNLPYNFSTVVDAVNSQRNLAYNYYQLISRHFSISSPSRNKQLFGDEKIILFNSNSDDRYRPDLDTFLSFTLANQANHLSFSNQLIRNLSQFEKGIKFTAFRACDFSNTNISAVHISNNLFIRCNFQKSTLRNNWIYNAEFLDCNFSDSRVDLLENIRRDNFPEKLVFKNKFIGCNFSQSTLNKGETFRTRDRKVEEKKRFLFWDCDLDNVDFGDRTGCTTVKYSNEYKGKKWIPKTRIRKASKKAAKH